MFEVRTKLSELLHNKLNVFFKRNSAPSWSIFVLDVFAVFLSLLLAYLLRFNLIIGDINFKIAFNNSILCIGIYAVFMFFFKTYSELLRHTTVIDIFNLLLATTFSMITLFCISITSRIAGWIEDVTVPYSIIFIHYVLVIVVLIITRLSVKIVYLLVTSSLGKKKKVLIYGAGEMGVIVKRVIMSDVRSCYQIAGFLDDDKKLQGKILNGISVFNPDILFSDFLIKHEIETLIFAVKDILPSRKSEIIHLAMNIGCEILETPPVDKWLNGQLQMSQIKKVKFKDLLGRDSIRLNMELIGKGLKDRVILVTGAAGSIGSEIIRQLTRFPIKKIILIDQAETPMFHLQNELKEKYSNISVHPILADVTNKEKMENIFRRHKPNIVFHAAAYKHVPLMEENPHEAIRVNIGGTKLITELSVKYRIKKFVLISTDKAVNPTNIMGASKRVCEMIVQMHTQMAESNTQFVITRFGNVLGSNGSVIPLFSKQIEEGGPVTVTHPEITRYFMTIPEACELVLEAGFMGKGGEIFVFDMGKPIKIVDLANQMIRLSGLIPNKDIIVQFTGLRPGEKLYEELLADKENTIPTHHPKIMIAKTEKLSYEKQLENIDQLIHKIYSLSEQEVVNEFKKLVPEYQCNNKDLINYNEAV